MNDELCKEIQRTLVNYVSNSERCDILPLFEYIQIMDIKVFLSEIKKN